jgi:hypothetical protein
MVISFQYLLTTTAFLFVNANIVLDNIHLIEEDKINSFIELIGKFTYKGFWELEKNRTFNYFENNHGLIIMNINRYNLTSKERDKDFIRFILQLFDGNYNNKWVKMVFYGLSFHNMTYNFQSNLISFDFNTSIVELGEKFESSFFTLYSII